MVRVRTDAATFTMKTESFKQFSRTCVMVPGLMNQCLGFRWFMK